MNASDVVTILKDKGIDRTEAAIKSMASKYKLYLPKKEATSYSGLDPVKMQDLINVLSSPLRVSRIVKKIGCTYSKAQYFILKNYIVTEKKYGYLLLKKKGDLENVRKHLKK